MMRPSPAEHRLLEQMPSATYSIMFSGTNDEHFHALRVEVLCKRDRAILGCITEIIVSLVSMVLVDIRRSLLIPVLNVVLVVLSCVGLHGALNLTLREVQVHGVVTTGLIAAAVLNFFAEAFLTHTGMSSGPFPAWIVMALLLAPYSLNMFCSLLSLTLQSTLADLFEFVEKGAGLLSADALEAQAVQMSGSESCCVCMDRAKDSVLTPCGHRAVCYLCGDKLRVFSRSCPVCRQRIDGVVRVFDS